MHIRKNSFQCAQLMILQILDIWRTWTSTLQHCRKKKSHVAGIDWSLKRLSLQVSKQIQWSVLLKIIYQVSSLIKSVLGSKHSGKAWALESEILVSSPWLHVLKVCLANPLNMLLFKYLPCAKQSTLHVFLFTCSMSCSYYCPCFMRHFRFRDINNLPKVT